MRNALQKLAEATDKYLDGTELAEGEAENLATFFFEPWKKLIKATSNKALARKLGFDAKEPEQDT